MGRGMMSPRKSLKGGENNGKSQNKKGRSKRDKVGATNHLYEVFDQSQLGHPETKRDKPLKVYPFSSPGALIEIDRRLRRDG